MSCRQTTKARCRAFAVLIASVCLCGAAFQGIAVDTGSLPPPANRKVDFVRDIQPIISKNCYGCHGSHRQEAQLRWDNKQIALQGGEHGAVIVPGKSAQSRMIQLVAGLEPENVMPKKGDRLTPGQVGILRSWHERNRAKRTFFSEAIGRSPAS